ncbi:MAG TPA: serine protease [Solirubrobacteraceae bacterium]|nr:serine protease [Solirubrobacteraceae bacterium]
MIGRRRDLTAAHCVLGAKTKQVDVLVGRTRLSVEDGRRIGVESISLYPGFVSGREKSLDAAVLVLDEPAGVPPLAVARPGQAGLFRPGTEAWTMGWGALNARMTPGKHVFYADRLRELALPVQGDDACEGAFGVGFPDYPYRPQWVLCAGTAAGVAGTCSGDSGGPLVVRSGDAWVDIGVLSGGDACASRGFYDLFARVDAVSAFALAPDVTAQPDPKRPPRVVGDVLGGRRVRCAKGRWSGDAAHFTYLWTGARGRVVGRDPTYRLTRRDVRVGVRCAVTAANAGGRATAVSLVRRRA